MCPARLPQDCDTPSEVLARAVDRHALHADSATQLVELFEEARFSPHVMNEGHRDTAVRGAATGARGVAEHGMKKLVAAGVFIVVLVELVAFAVLDRELVLLVVGVMVALVLLCLRLVSLA